uniref:Putative phosphoadenosine phosphosulfate n=1 Tax=viral metagenome TaxID=1070528 RepID=A0A6M3KZU8_9ZZZZ
MIDFFNTTKEQRKTLLKADYNTRLEATKECIRQVLAKAKRPVIQFSGGADSCVLGWFIHNIDKTVPFLFNDWGLFLPRTKEFVLEYFNKYKVKYFISDSGYNYKSFMKEKGLPIFKGVRKIVTKKDYKKYNISEDCRKLKNICWKKFINEYHPDYYFIGIIADELAQRKTIFINHGFIQKKEYNTFSVKPIVLLTKKEIFSILEENKILWAKDAYEYEYKGKTVKWYDCSEKIKVRHSDLECFICPVRFTEEGWGRLGRLARKYPKIYEEVMKLGIRDSFIKIIQDYPNKSDYIKRFLKTYPITEEDKNIKIRGLF